MVRIDLEDDEFELVQSALVDRAVRLRAMSANEGSAVSVETREIWRRCAKEHGQLAFKLAQSVKPAAA